MSRETVILEVATFFVAAIAIFLVTHEVASFLEESELIKLYGPKLGNQLKEILSGTD